MGQVNVEAVGASVLLVVDDGGQHTELLMPRDLAARIGLALVQAATAKGSALDELVDLDRHDSNG